MIIQIICFSGKKSDYDGLSEKLITPAKHKGCKNLLTKKEDQIGVDEILTQHKYDIVSLEILGKASFCECWAVN